jgi:chorismate synthase
MSGSSFGQLFRISTYGESHGHGIGVIIDGCPAGIEIDNEFLQNEMARRKPGQSKIVTQRHEDDEAILQSGVFEGKTTGTPIHIFIPNEDQRSKDYGHIATKYRPSHADYVYDSKYGFRDYRGGGRSSARETAARVAAGAIAKMILTQYGVQISAFVSQVGQIAYDFDTQHIVHSPEINDVRCPDEAVGNKMIELIQEIKKQGDTIGGRVTCFITGTPVGLGDPVFDKLHADLGKAMLSINACKGFEYGSGFSSISMKGSQHNDVFENTDNSITTKTNFSGGIQGGISNGMPIYFNVAFKPVATIIPEQDSVDNSGQPTTIVGKGRHDPCVVPRAVPIVEAMAALVLIDHLLRQNAYRPITISK